MVGLILAFGLIFAIDFLPLIKYKDKKSMVTFCIIFLVTFIVAVLLVMGVEMPSIYELMHKLFTRIGLAY